jgi:hypothetical protein
MFRDILFLCAATLSFSVMSSEEDGTIPRLSHGDYFFTKLTPMAEVRHSIERRMIDELGLKPEIAQNAPISRLFVSDWFGVSIDGKGYVVNSDASYWMQGGMGEMFMFTPSVQRVSVSNGNRGRLLNLMLLINAYKDTLVTYPSTTGYVRERIYAFMDVTCPYCRKFHLTERQELQAQGYEFVYIPYAKEPNNQDVIDLNLWAFCAENELHSKRNIDSAYLVAPKARDNLASSPKCDNESLKFIAFLMGSGEKFSLVGSPAFFTGSADVIYGSAALERYTYERNKYK